MLTNETSWVKAGGPIVWKMTDEMADFDNHVDTGYINELVDLNNEELSSYINFVGFAVISLEHSMSFPWHQQWQGR